MNTNAENLWGDIPTSEDMRTPSTILREQASKLTELTQGLLEGEVVFIPYDNISFAHKLYERLDPNQQKFYGTLRIKVPSLANYTYSLLEIGYSIQAYPVFVRNLAGEDSKQECANEEEFKVVLRGILSSDEVKRVIAILLSQIQAEVR
ncbi:MAG: hypothetical protein J7647_13270 [Cyanobacteria bacterium SBLK]|nr:hypothetical protein [Cyanobacteria bacterium SBLK]